MTLPTPTYDLTLLLDPDSEEATRAKIVADARASIEAKGELARYDDWGTRTLTYQIDKKSAAEYHLLQFHPQSAELLSELDRTLRITDGILRFRIIKLKPGVPEAPDMRSPVAPPARAEAAPAGVQSEIADGEVEVEAVVEVGDGTPAAADEMVLEPDAPEPDAPEPQGAPDSESAPAETAEPQSQPDEAG